MSIVVTFTTQQTLEAWARQGHNRRTRGAWEHGVRAAVFGLRPIYGQSMGDYARAEREGRGYADAALRMGWKWKCGECDALHPAPPPAPPGREEG